MNAYHSALLSSVLAVSILLVVACDLTDENAPDPEDLEGTFTVNTFRFTTEGVDNFDVLADTLAAVPELEFFGANQRATLTYQVEGREATSQLSGPFETDDDVVVVDFSDTPVDARRQLLLPPTLELEVFGDRDSLAANLRRDSVDLNSYAPQRYAGLTQPVDGTLRLRLSRTASEPLRAEAPAGR